MESTNEKKLRTFQGVVIKTGSAKTITVRVDRMKLHSKYQKRYRVSSKYHVHDERAEARLGAVVSFSECRPLSKTKRWRLISVVKTNQ